MSENDERIKQLKNRIEDLKSETARYQKELESLYVERIKSKYGITIGMIVNYRGKRYRVEAIERFMLEHLDKPWLIGVPQKKNGEFGTRRTMLYAYWEKVA